MMALKKSRLRIGEALATIKDTMVKTMQTMVGVTDTIFFAAVTVVSEVGTR